MSVMKYLSSAVIGPIVTGTVILVGIGAGSYYVLPKMMKAHTDELLKNAQHDTLSKLVLIVNEKLPLLSAKKKLEVAQAIYTGCILHDIPPSLVLGVIDVETAGTWDVEAKSSVNAAGLMQIMPAMGRVYMRVDKVDFSLEKLRDPAMNISIGIAMLADFQADHVAAGRVKVDDFTAALHSYNNGPKPTAEVYKQKNFDPTTLTYPKNVFDAAKKYKDLGI